MYISESRRILQEIPERDRNLAALNAQRYVNMVGGRPSDAARSEVRAYQSLGDREYRRRFDQARDR